MYKAFASQVAESRKIVPECLRNRNLFLSLNGVLLLLGRKSPRETGTGIAVSGVGTELPPRHLNAGEGDKETMRS